MKNNNKHLKNLSLCFYIVGFLTVFLSCEKPDDLDNDIDEEIDEEIELSQHYYINAETGDDDNSGRTAETPWKTLNKVNKQNFEPGDKILFMSNQSWEGTLKPKGSGSVNNPIIIDKYGDGNKPGIHGQGAPSAIHLDNNEYFEIHNLEVTNFSSSEEGGISLNDWESKNLTDWADVILPERANISNTDKIGIKITAKDIGEVNHIHLKDLHIHGINGKIDSSEDSKHNGGIFIEITGSEIPTFFNDLLIENCHIHDIDRTGLSNMSSWETRTLTTNENWTPSLNYIVRNNIFERSGANALIVRVAKDPLIESNLFHQNGIKGSGNAAFNFNTDGAIMQYNEARFTKANFGDADAGGLDSDFRTKNTIIQYNYLHDNDYGMLATGGGYTGSFNDGTIIRYNIIERDGLVRRDNGEKFALKISGKITNTLFHNNVIYLSPEQEDVDIIFHKNWGGNPENTQYFNNIFYLEGNNHTINLGGSSENEFSHNLFYGNQTITWPSDSEAVHGDPLFQTPGGGELGYKVKPGSPAIDSGLLIDNLPDKDYYGNQIPSGGPVNIGVDQN